MISDFGIFIPGTSIAVYGIFLSSNLGSLNATYSIDGLPLSSSLSVNASSPSYLDDLGQRPNYLYFRLDGLLSGAHTLLVNITEANNQTFMLDYITYKPAFDTLASMPSLASGISPGSTSTQRLSTGALVGCVLGGLAFGVLVTIFVIWFILRRRGARAQDYAHPDASLGSGPGVNDPNILSLPSFFLNSL